MHILSNEQQAELYGPPSVTEEERELSFSLNDNEKSKLLDRESELIKIYYILYLGYFKQKAVQLRPELHTIKNDFEYIRDRYFPNSHCVIIQLTPNQKYKIYTKIFDVVAIKRFGASSALELEIFAKQAAVSQNRAVELFDEVIDWLRIQDIEIPSYNKLQEIVTTAFNKEKNRVISIADSVLSQKTQRLFKRFLTDSEQKQMFSYIRYEGRDFSKSELNKELEVFDILAGIANDVLPMIVILGIPNERIKYYAELFSEISLSRQKKRREAEFNLYLSCFIYYRYRSLVDYFGDAFIFHVDQIKKEAHEAANAQMLKVKSSMDDLMVEGAKILSFFTSDSKESFSSFAEAKNKAEEILGEDQLNNLITHMSRSKFEKDRYFWEFIDTCKSKITVTLRNILCRLKFVDTVDSGLLLQQVDRLKIEVEEKGLVETIDNRLAKKTKDYLYDPARNLIATRAEYHIYSLVSQRLHNTHWCLDSGIRYQPLEKMLVAENEVGALLECVNAEAIKKDVSGLLDDKLDELNKMLSLVPCRVKTKENESLILERHDGKHSWTIKKVKGTKIVNPKMFDSVPKTDITRVIFRVAQDSGFMDDILHRTGKKRTEKFEEKLIACIIANATRRGIYKMADLCPFSHDTLLRFEKNYLTVENVRHSCDTISNAISKLKIFGLYNYRPDYIHASLDGQKLHSRKNTKRVRYSSKKLWKGKRFVC